jgi:hypothetical protein
MPHKPSWFKDGQVIGTNSATCGINKDGNELYRVDSSGKRSATERDDEFAVDVQHVLSGQLGKGKAFSQPLANITQSRVWVPQYHDFSSVDALKKCFGSQTDFRLASLRDAVKEGILTVRHGHGSPSDDQRVGDIPYIKVSDIRAGHININPTNLVPLELAKKYWGGPESGLKAYDLISPERASKNIGEFAILMPGQERILLTKEVIIVRGNAPQLFDQFYLLWALTLTLVRDQWRRIVLMQTNREDVGDRLYEVVIPIPKSKPAGDTISKDFRDYYQAIEKARTAFATALKNSPSSHHVFLG